MFYRCLTLIAVALTWAFVGAELRAERNPVQHEGTVVSAGAGKLAMKDNDGKQHSFTIESEVRILVNGRPGKLEELQPTMPIRVMLNAAGKVLTVSTIDGRKTPSRASQSVAEFNILKPLPRLSRML